METFAQPWDTIARVQTLIASQTSYTHRSQGLDDAYTECLDDMECPDESPLSESDFASVARNRIKRSSRRAHLIASKFDVNEISVPPSPEDAAMQCEILDSIRKVLSEKDKDILYARSIGYSCQEIAWMFKKSQSAVRSSICRIRKRVNSIFHQAKSS